MRTPHTVTERLYRASEGWAVMRPVHSDTDDPNEREKRTGNATCTVCACAEGRPAPGCCRWGAEPWTFPSVYWDRIGPRQEPGNVQDLRQRGRSLLPPISPSQHVQRREERLQQPERGRRAGVQ
ncbi:hypothetical protein NDU88_005879 [Pleurodeles waltl]|uniref:Uncharacterized protein n=1 Tax=Pleurodeles waltl TaxID=8319 RepID=A0AAV7PK50_PLEWA|nr:hypothetical protein NDU88_005879 [Pleurodeles waltl]